MIRKLSTFISVVFGALLLLGAGCEDKAAKQALGTCNTNLQDLQKTSSAQATSLTQMKAELAQAQARLQELTKELERIKTSQPTKAETPAAPKAAPGKKK